MLIPYPDIPDPDPGKQPNIGFVTERISTGVPVEQALTEWHRGFSTVELKQQVNSLTRTQQQVPLPYGAKRIELLEETIVLREYGF